jgi:hypothetical protein
VKPAVAQQLGEQLGEFIKSNNRFPEYLHVLVKYHLGKPLLPKFAMKVKGRRQMLITLRYENVPHFYYSCGHIGHMAMSCDDTMAERSMAWHTERSFVPLHRGG